MPYFWTHIFFYPPFYIPVGVVIVAWFFWRRGLRLNKYENLTARGCTLTNASLIYGIFMAAFYVIEGLTEPSIASGEKRYMMHGQQWGKAGMALSVIGVLIAVCGRGAARILIALLMMALFAWWYFIEAISHFTF